MLLDVVLGQLGTAQGNERNEGKQVPHPDGRRNERLSEAGKVSEDANWPRLRTSGDKVHL